MTGSYDIWLVILSVVVASLASYVAVDLVSRVVASTARKSKWFWLVGGSLSMGMGIWCMRFIGTLTYRLPIQCRTTSPITLISLSIAVGWRCLWSGGAMTSRNSVGAGCLMGSGIVAMHYTGMA